MKDVSVIIFEDNDDLRESLRLLINGTPGFAVRATYANGAAAAQAVTDHQPDVVLMDFEMPEVDGIQALKAIKQSRPETHVVMLTIFDQNEHVFEAMCNGANGYLLKRSAPTEIIKAIEEVMSGGAPMTPAIAKKVLSFFAKQRTVKPDSELTSKESEVLKWLVDGYSYKMIAAELEVSLDTIRTHIKNIYRKLQVNSMTEAVSKAIRQGLV